MNYAKDKSVNYFLILLLLTMGRIGIVNASNSTFGENAFEGIIKSNIRDQEIKKKLKDLEVTVRRGIARNALQDFKKHPWAKQHEKAIKALEEETKEVESKVLKIMPSTEDIEHDEETNQLARIKREELQGESKWISEHSINYHLPESRKTLNTLQKHFIQKIQPYRTQLDQLATLNEAISQSHDQLNAIQAQLAGRSIINQPTFDLKNQYLHILKTLGKQLHDRLSLKKNIDIKTFFTMQTTYLQELIQLQEQVHQDSNVVQKETSEKLKPILSTLDHLLAHLNGKLERAIETCIPFIKQHHGILKPFYRFSAYRHAYDSLSDDYEDEFVRGLRGPLWREIRPEVYRQLWNFNTAQQVVPQKDFEELRELITKDFPWIFSQINYGNHTSILPHNRDIRRNSKNILRTHYHHKQLLVRSKQRSEASDIAQHQHIIDFFTTWLNKNEYALSYAVVLSLLLELHAELMQQTSFLNHMQLARWKPNDNYEMIFKIKNILKSFENQPTKQSASELQACFERLRFIIFTCSIIKPSLFTNGKVSQRITELLGKTYEAIKNDKNKLSKEDKQELNNFIANCFVVNPITQKEYETLEAKFNQQIKEFKDALKSKKITTEKEFKTEIIKILEEYAKRFPENIFLQAELDKWQYKNIFGRSIQISGYA